MAEPKTMHSWNGTRHKVERQRKGWASGDYLAPDCDGGILLSRADQTRRPYKRDCKRCFPSSDASLGAASTTLNPPQVSTQETPMSADHWAKWKVRLPEIDQDGVRVERFTVADRGIENLRLAMSGRACAPGEYTKLHVDGRLWMSDTPAEVRDHQFAYWQMHRRGGRVLINGLGLGMVVQWALDLPNVEHVDVVELDPRIAHLIGKHYESERCTVHLGDALALTWPAGTRWTVAWHDIWPDICADNLPTMHRLHRMYGRRTDWQGSWARGLCERAR